MPTRAGRPRQLRKRRAPVQSIETSPTTISRIAETDSEYDRNRIKWDPTALRNGHTKGRGEHTGDCSPIAVDPLLDGLSIANVLIPLSGLVSLAATFRASLQATGPLRFRTIRPRVALHFRTMFTMFGELGGNEEREERRLSRQTYGRADTAAQLLVSWHERGSRISCA